MPVPTPQATRASGCSTCTATDTPRPRPPGHHARAVPTELRGAAGSPVRLDPYGGTSGAVVLGLREDRGLLGAVEVVSLGAGSAQTWITPLSAAASSQPPERLPVRVPQAHSADAHRGQSSVRSEYQAGDLM